MSKAAQAIEFMIEQKQKQLYAYIRNNKQVLTWYAEVREFKNDALLNDFIFLHKDILIPFANLKKELADLRQQRYTIAINRIKNLISFPQHVHVRNFGAK